MAVPHRRRPGPGPRAVLALALGALLVLALPGGPAAAHATLVGTDPAGDAVVDELPEAIELRFDEPVATTTGSVRVIDPGGGRVDGPLDSLDGGATLRVAVDGDAVGTYTVAYRVVSDDGHTITGSFVVHVQTRTGAADIDQSVPLSVAVAGSVGRWLSYAGAVVAVGAALLVALTLRTGGPGAARGPLATMVAAGALVGAAGGDLAVLAQVATTTGRSLTGALGLVTDVASESRPVGVALARATVVLLGAGLALAGRRRPRLLVAAGAVVAVGGLLAPVAGHPWTATSRAIAVPADALHLTAASVWLGLVAALAVAGPRLPDPRRAVRQVSSAALVSALVVFLTGVASGALLLGSLDALFQTASGQLVLLKVIGFGGLVFLGWLNRARLVPLLDRVAGAGDDPVGDDEAEGRGTALGPLLRVVRVEVAVGALVLAVTAGLVNQPPGRDQLARPFAEQVEVDGVTARLEVSPARAGDNEMHLYVTDDAGLPAAFDAVEITAATDGVPERRLASEQISPDHAVAYGASLPTPGTWTIEVTTVHLGTAQQYRFEVPVR